MLQSETLVNSIRAPLLLIYWETKQSSVSFGSFLKLRREKSAAFPWGTISFLFFNTNQLLLFEIFCFMNTFISLFYLFQGEPGLQPSTAAGWSHISLLQSSAYILLTSQSEAFPVKGNAPLKKNHRRRWKTGTMEANEGTGKGSRSAVTALLITTGILYKDTRVNALKTLLPAFFLSQ